MTVRPIVLYPDDRLYSPARSVPNPEAPDQVLIDDLLETMHAIDATGLAAPQLGIRARVIVARLDDADVPPTDDDDDDDNVIVLVNPVMLEYGGHVVWEESCVSFPGRTRELERAAWVRVRGYDRHGVKRTVAATSRLAVTLQHQLDHLEGLLRLA